MLEQVVGLVREWRPERRYRLKDRYRRDLCGFLRARLGANVKCMRRRGAPDIVVGESVGIFIVRHLTSRDQFKRLISDVKRWWASGGWCAVVVLVGNVREEYYRELVEMERDNYFSEWVPLDLSIRRFRIVSATKDRSRGGRGFWGF